MFMTKSDSQYDRGINTFSPEGRLFQVEYAIEAIKLGSTAIGIQTSEGVVLAVEKRITSPLLEPSSVEKIFQIDGHVGFATSGLTADSSAGIIREDRLCGITVCCSERASCVSVRFESLHYTPTLLKHVCERLTFSKGQEGSSFSISGTCRSAHASNSWCRYSKAYRCYAFACANGSCSTRRAAAGDSGSFCEHTKYQLAHSSK